MKERNLWKYETETGEIQKIGREELCIGSAEDKIQNYFEEKGWKVINISPNSTGESIPEELSGLEKMFKEGVYDLFLYGKEDESNKFVEVKGEEDGLKLNQIRFANSNKVDKFVIFIEKEKEQFECGDCGRVFDTQNGLKTHKANCYTESEDSPIKLNRVSYF